ncbi:MAG: Ig-like domain-containing protein [Actinomycetota bacterium]
MPDIVQPEEIAEKEPEADEEIIEVVPTIFLEIIEGPLYSSVDSVCYYRVEATMRGTQSPEIEWSKDDSFAAFGENIAQVNLHDINETYTLVSTAENVAGTATDSIELSWGCNCPPVIDEITLRGDHYTEVEYMVSVSASDPDGDVLSYSWSGDMGTIENPETNPIEWKAPDEPSTVNIAVIVTDGRGGTDSMTESVEVIEMNKPPEAGKIEIYEKGDTTPVKFVFTDQEYELFIEASDPNDDLLSYAREASGGAVDNKNMNPAIWTTPSSMGDYVIKVKISDGKTGSIEKTKTIEAKHYIY